MKHITQIAAALASLILVAGVLALSFAERDIPPELAISLTASISYLFGSVTADAVADAKEQDPK